MINQYRIFVEIGAVAVLLIGFLFYRAHLIDVGERNANQAQQQAVNKALTDQASKAMTESKRVSELERSAIAQREYMLQQKDREIARLQSIKPETLVKTVTIHDQACPVVSLSPDFRELYDNAGARHY